MIKKIGILLVLLLPFQVQAAMTGDIKLNCDKTTIPPGGILTCKLTTTVQGDYLTSFEGHLTTSENMTIISVTPSSIWSDPADDNFTYMEYYLTGDSQQGTINVATITIQASSNITTGANEYVKVSETVLYGETNYKGITIANTQQNIRLAATGNNLSSLSIANGTLTPSFQNDITSYSTAIDASTTTIQATTTDPNATISGNVGEVNLNYGLNTFSIYVKSEAGITKNYTLLITRPDTRSTNNSLATLTINKESIDIKENVYDYLYQVEEDIEEITIETTLQDSKTNFIDGYGPRTISLEKGKNTVEIKTKAENGEERTYVIVITRGTDITDENNTNQNPGTSNQDSSKTDTLTNPKTGTSFIYIVVLIVILAIILGVIGYRMYQKGEGERNEK